MNIHGHTSRVARRTLPQTISTPEMPKDLPDAAESKTGADFEGMSSRRPTRILARERLLAQLLEARRKRCVVLQGPVGSGKTTLLLAWRESLLLLGFGVAWQMFSHEDNDLAHCLDRLVASLGQVNPEICREASLLAGRGMDEEAVERIIIALVRGIAHHQGDVMLVMDDLHHVTHPRIYETLQSLLDFAPSNLHIVLVSRASIPLSLGRLRDQGRVLELDMRDLRFTAAESEAFLKAQLGEVSPREARHLHELTDGWAAGLQLLAMRVKRKKQDGTDVAPTPTLTRTYLLDVNAFEEYFEREVLSHLSCAEVELLVRMAACDRLCASLCIALANDVQSPAEVLSHLAKLESDNLFITTITAASDQTWYSLNPLFRETLLQRLRGHDKTYQRKIHLAAWAWFRDHEKPDDAVRHALLAGESAAAIELVQQVARTMRIQGNFRKLASLIRLLPATEIRAHVDLRLWLARLHMYERDIDACTNDIERLQADIPKGNNDARYQLTLLQAALAMQRDDADAASSFLPQLLRIPDKADGLVLGGRNNVLSWIYVRRGEYERARRVQAESPQQLVDATPLIGTSAGTLSGRCLIGLSYASEGKFVQAERIYRDVLFEANQHGSIASEAACFASAFLGEVLYEFNELEAARKHLEDRIDILERVSIPDTVLRAFMALSAVHSLAGHRQEAFAYLKRLEEYASQHDLHRLIAHSVAGQVREHLACGRNDAAQADLIRLDSMASGAASSSPLSSAEIQISAARAHVDWYIAQGDLEGAASRLVDLIVQCEALGWQRQLVHFQMQAAVIDFQSGRMDVVQQSVPDTLRRGMRLGLVRSLLDSHPDALDVISYAMQNEPHDPVLAFYMNRLQSAHSAPAGGKATNTPTNGRSTLGQGTEMLSERESRVVNLLAKALPNKKIARTLNISPETVKWHLKNIYGKLGVSSRDEAVARVRDLMLDANSDADMADGTG